MATRSLTPREEKLKEQFNGCGLELIAMENVTLGNKDSIYMVNGAILYRIKNTNSYLLYGEPVNYSSILEKLKNSSNNPEELKKLFGEQMGGETELEGERQVEGEMEVEGEIEAGSVIEREVEGAETYNEEDVELIMSEVKITKEEALKALKSAGNDVIQALVDLNKKI